MQKIRIAGRTIEVGKTYTGTNGAEFTVDAIWKGDRYNLDRVDYTLADGRTGGTPINSMFYWIEWAA